MQEITKEHIIELIKKVARGEYKSYPDNEAKSLFHDKRVRIDDIRVVSRRRDYVEYSIIPVDKTVKISRVIVPFEESNKSVFYTTEYSFSVNFNEAPTIYLMTVVDTQTDELIVNHFTASYKTLFGKKDITLERKYRKPKVTFVLANGNTKYELLEAEAKGLFEYVLGVKNQAKTKVETDNTYKRLINCGIINGEDTNEQETA